jgi:hypothetical protein
MSNDDVNVKLGRRSNWKEAAVVYSEKISQYLSGEMRNQKTWVKLAEF